MSCPPIRWEHWHSNHYAHLGDSVKAFAVVGECVGRSEGLWNVRIIRPGSDLYGGRYATLEKAKASVERWTRSHWRTVVMVRNP